MTTMRDVRGLTWYLFWRYALATVIGGYIVGFVLGFVVGFVLAMFGLSSSIPFAATVSGAIGGGLFAFFTLNFLLARAIGREFGGRTLRFDSED